MPKERTEGYAKRRGGESEDGRVASWVKEKEERAETKEHSKSAEAGDADGREIGTEDSDLLDIE